MIVPHPLFERDIIGMAEHVLAVSGDGNAARRRVLEARALLACVQEDPDLGRPLDGDLSGWRIRHGGKHRQNSVVYRYDGAANRLYLALLSFDGQDCEGPQYPAVRIFPKSDRNLTPT